MTDPAPGAEPVWPPPDASDAALVSSPDRRRDLRRTLRPTRPDLAMALAGVATIFWWSTGSVSFRLLVVVVLCWSVLWIWRIATPGWWIWASVAAISTLVIIGNSPHWAYRISSGCLTEHARASLAESVVAEDIPVGDAAVPGRCSALWWSTHGTIVTQGYRLDEPDPATIAVYRSGPPLLSLFGGEHGYAFSPDLELDFCGQITGPSNANNGYRTCTVEPLGGDWYWYEAVSALD